MSSEVTSTSVTASSTPSDDSLFSAVSRNDLTRARQILRLSTEEIETLEPFVVRGQARYTPLLRAIANKNLKMVMLLLDYGANPNARADDLCGTTPLNLAVQGGPALHRILDVLLACIELDPDATDAADVTALMTAALLGSDNYVLEALVERGADVNKARCYEARGRHTPLMLAAKSGHGEVVRFLRNKHVEEFELFNGNIARELAKGSAIEAFEEVVSSKRKSAQPQSLKLTPAAQRLRCGPSLSRAFSWDAAQPSTSAGSFFEPESVQLQSSMSAPSTQRPRRGSSLGPVLGWDAAQSFTFEESFLKPESVTPQSSTSSNSEPQPGPRFGQRR